MKPIQIKIWLLRNDYRQAEIAQELGVSRHLVWKTINGREGNRRVLRWLRDHGCPENYLDPAKRRAA